MWAIRNSQGRSGGISSLQFLQRHESAGERVLHDVLAVDHRSHQTRAIAVQLGPQLAGERQELRVAVAVGGLVLRSSRRSLEHGYSRVALEPEGEALGIFRVVQHGNNFLAELARRHRRAEAGQELFGA